MIQELIRLGVKVPQPMVDADAVRQALQAASIYNDNSDIGDLTDRLHARTISAADAVAAFDTPGDNLLRRKMLGEVLGDVATSLDVADGNALADSAPESLNDRRRAAVGRNSRSGVG